ncbi:hypothetical protein BHE74_00007938 [Ensete ventricosum]|uniref:Uncharacterized protein n=1 Tax=Ensete ventricosum TaxID=4639 RepID=A0A426YQB4_ENSVE|nr:hypothetical protein B296_00039105 [Ensete ventricosum]RWW83551.1 hypothetical protein BHE74_00007938 [Ensete ventricosum]RZR96647.1 hypothetical protein BHM03_00025711 [Ensete ventricosum]
MGGVWLDTLANEEHGRDIAIATFSYVEDSLPPFIWSLQKLCVHRMVRMHELPDDNTPTMEFGVGDRGGDGVPVSTRGACGSRG